MHDVMEPADALEDRRPRPAPRHMAPEPLVLPTAGTFDEDAPRRGVLPDVEAGETSGVASTGFPRPGKRTIAALALGGAAVVVVAVVALSSGSSGSTGPAKATLRNTEVAAAVSVPTVSQQCAGLTCTFSTAALPQGETVQWTFGDGSDPATGTTVRHTYAKAGSYAATASGTLGANSATADPVTVRVGGTARPTAALSAGGHVLTISVTAPASCLPAPYALQRSANGWRTVRSGRLTAATSSLGVHDTGAYRIVLPSHVTAGNTTCAATTSSTAVVRATAPASTAGNGSGAASSGGSYSGSYTGTYTGGSSAGTSSSSGTRSGTTSGSGSTKSGGRSGSKSGGSTGAKSGSGGTKSGGSGGSSGGLTPITGGLYTPPPPSN